MAVEKYPYAQKYPSFLEYIKYIFPGVMQFPSKVSTLMLNFLVLHVMHAFFVLIKQKLHIKPLIHAVLTHV